MQMVNVEVILKTYALTVMSVNRAMQRIVSILCMYEAVCT